MLFEKGDRLVYSDVEENIHCEYIIRGEERLHYKYYIVAQDDNGDICLLNKLILIKSDRWEHYPTNRYNFDEDLFTI